MVTLIKEVCGEMGIACEALSRGYVLQITKPDKPPRHVMGAYWDINSAAADRIACDKVACYAVLRKAGVSAVPHTLLLHPTRRAAYVNGEDVYKLAARYFHAHRKHVVIKPNNGTKGEGVYFCDSVEKTINALQELFETLPDAAISPFYPMKAEYRVFYVNGKCPLSYGKTRGPGGQHNLSQGGRAFELPAESQAKLAVMAVRAAAAIGITFATIDIAHTEKGLRIMEINAGVQCRHLLTQLPHLQNKIKGIYRRAIELL